ncbi:MAG: flagellar hook-length control protein FliK [Hydrogenimonas sp.]|nr:flagellar hook-length control protein FliK [Hydrogenimonas sp.]
MQKSSKKTKQNDTKSAKALIVANEEPPLAILEAKSEPTIASFETLGTKGSTKNDNALLFARHSSQLKIENDAIEAKAINHIKESTSLKELIDNAQNSGLRVTQLKVTTTEQKSPQSGTLTQATELLKQIERISIKAAETIERSRKTEAAKTIEPKQTSKIPTLQTLLSQSDVGSRESTKAESLKAESKETRFIAKENRDDIFKSIHTQSKELIRSTAHQEIKAANSETNIAQIDTSLSEKEGIEMLNQNIKTFDSSEQLNRKIVDAKATLRHFAQTLQEQVENYKPPFTRMQISLDPKELGSVEVTMVSRGSNLHIQVHSNPTAIGVMATHGNELRNQLVSMGFTDVQMQFNMNQQQQQHNQRQQQNFENSYSDSDEPLEFYESLELTLPKYV